MLEVILTIVGVACLLAGWRWHMLSRWIRLLCRTFTVYCVLAILLLLGWSRIGAYFVLFIIPVIIVPLFFFWEVIPFPILQFFKTDNTTTIRIEKKDRGIPSGIDYRRDMKHNPERFIYSYIQSVNISPFKYRHNYLNVRSFIFSALPYHLELDNISVRLIVDGATSKSQPMLEDGYSPKKYMKLYAENSTEKTIRIFFSKKRREEILGYVQKHKSFKVCLEIVGKDKNDKEYCLETRETKMIFWDE